MPKVAIVGAGGLVGRRMVDALDKSGIPDVDILPTGHQRSVGQTVMFRGKRLQIEPTDFSKLRRCDIVVLCTPAEASREIVYALRGGPVLVDTSSAFRLDDDVPLIVPEVNPEALSRHNGLIAGPNCSTIQLVMVLNPIHRLSPLRRVVVSTYQSVSGVGYAALKELEDQSFEVITTGRPAEPRQDSNFTYQIAFNLIPQIGSFSPDGFTGEERKMMAETRKIMSCPNLAIACTCVRVPVFLGHSESCLLETESRLSAEVVRDALARAPGVVVMDDPDKCAYPMPSVCWDRDEVFVGRIRNDPSSETGLLLWVVADNLRRGAATNACNIVRLLLCP